MRAKRAMMKIKQFRYSSDNLGYVIYGEKSAVAIDGGAVEVILSFLDKNGLQLEFAANTHSHPDHTVGTRSLVSRSRSEYLDNNVLRRNKEIELEGTKISVYHTPGHTEDSLCFHVENLLITGDTLFNGTIGNCFTGDLDAFFESVKLLMRFPQDTLVYAGHDYVSMAMAFAKHLEPDNKDINRFLKQYDSAHVRSMLGDEFKVNPYLRFNEESIVSLLRTRGLPVETEEQRWHSLMSVE